MSRGMSRQVRIVFIDTQYVETDATNFKSIVHGLTGKDSMVGVEPPLAKTRVVKPSGVGDQRVVGSSVFSRGVSFKDFDRLLMELPPLDELFSAI
ncbi:hypothetical protein Acr_17g0008910 [Actinidia rufa]|uniref:VQ domain-containing protein n=1 Tax=Actinidia rufa TaxID=165716 RepID=A0A7J0G3H2_9ERIC|nr:hypothetical protein Acr_17g0008910 [Actinidia rufa]